MTREENPGQTAPQAAKDEIARVLQARFVHAGAHSGARELCRILIQYRLRQLAEKNA
ncbi:MAG: hypothetical protein LBC37_04460 [Zoogloeaceae bacterium]|nr:hypothetical protein [Zoogloeaceae bacterium]